MLYVALEAALRRFGFVRSVTALLAVLALVVTGGTAALAAPTPVAAATHQVAQVKAKAVVAPPPGLTIPPKGYVPTSAEQAAVAAAKDSGLATEVVSERTDSSTVLAQPSGALVQQLYAAPFRVKVGSAWKNFDNRLLRDTAGQLEPTQPSSPIIFSGGGAGTAATLQAPLGAVSMGWPTPLPVPTVAGDTATYANVAAGTSLALTAQTNAFDFKIVLNAKPATAPVYTLPITVPAGSQLVTLPSGVPELQNAAGQAIVLIGTAQMFDASVDPMTKLPGKLTPVASSVTTTSSPTTLTMTLRPDMTFLSDPATKYPVTIDPPTQLPDNFDTMEISGSLANNNYDTDQHLYVGLDSAFSTVSRSFVRFTDSAVKNKVVIMPTTLALAQDTSATCANEKTDVRSSAQLTSGTTWNTKPAAGTTTYGTVLANVGSGNGCGNGQVSADITPLVQNWAGTGGTTDTLALLADNESDGNQFKTFFSGDTAFGPHINVTFATAPGAPTVSPTSGATAGNGQATVTWTDPTNNGGSAITKYTVTSSPGGFTATATGATATSARVTGLSNGTAYNFVVTATNAAGTSGNSTASNTVTPAAPPGAPTVSPTSGASAGNGQATVTWTDPTNNGGAAITGYTVTANPGGQTATASGATATSATVTGLTNGTSYTFTVTATNSAGTSAASAASNAVTPAGPPGSPIVSPTSAATAGNGQATVTWTDPTNNGGSTITSYTVTSSPGGVTQTVSGATATSATITGLTNGTSYTFTVTATNSAGFSATSTASNAVTPAAPPGAPTGVTASAGNAQATISWTAPSSNGGATITGYTVASSPGGRVATASGTATSATVTGLTNGTAYTFTVTATNGASTSPNSAASNAVTPATQPGAPTGVSATAGDGQATVTWSAPLFSGGVPITQYTVTSSPDSKTVTVSGNASSAVVTGLTNGTAYTFTVTAMNAIGGGAASAASAPVTPAPGTSPALTVPPNTIYLVGPSSAVGFGTSGTLTATVSDDLASSGATLQLLNQTAGTVVATCSSGTSCTTTIDPDVATNYIAKSGRIVSNVVTVAPAPWQLSIATNPADPTQNPNQLPVTITITSNHPVDGTGNVLSLYDNGNASLEASCSSGTTCSVTEPAASWGGSTGFVAPSSSVPPAHPLATSPIAGTGVEVNFTADNSSLLEGGTTTLRATANRTLAGGAHLQIWRTGPNNSGGDTRHLYIMEQQCDLDVLTCNLSNVAADPITTPGAIPTFIAVMCPASQCRSGTNVEYAESGPSQSFFSPGVTIVTATPWSGKVTASGERVPNGYLHLTTTLNQTLSPSPLFWGPSTAGTQLRSASGITYPTGGTCSSDGLTCTLDPIQLPSTPAAVADFFPMIWIMPDGNVAYLTEADVKAPSALELQEDTGGGNPSEANCHTCGGDPVDTSSGNLVESATDLSIPGRGPAFGVSRSYDSSSAGHSGVFGSGWSSLFDSHLTTGDPPATAFFPTQSLSITWVQENGSTVRFNDEGGGYWAAPFTAFATLTANPDGTYTITRNKRLKFTYNSSGQLISESNLNGYAITYGYTAGQLTSETDPAGRSITFGYDGNGHIQTATAPGNRIVQYFYDSSGNLTSVRDPLLQPTVYGYDSNDRLNTVKDPRLNTTTTYYGSDGRVSQQTDRANRLTVFSYTGSGPTGTWSTIVTDPVGNQIQYVYTDGQLTSTTTGYGTTSAATTTQTYDPTTLKIASTTDPNGHTSTFQYDADGNVLRAIDPNGHTTTASYDALDDQLTQTNPLGVTSTSTYDAAGNVLTNSTPLLDSSGHTIATRTTTFGYGDSYPGDVTAITDPNNHTTSYSYDSYGDLVSQTLPPTTENATGNETTYGYDTNTGWRTSTTSPRGNLAGANPADYTTQTAYDADGRPLSVHDPLWSSSNPTAHATVSTYDLDGNLQTVTDGNGNQTQFAYNADNQLTTTTRADHSTLVTDYYADGTIQDTKNGRHDPTAYTYTPRGQIQTETDPKGQTTSYSYDLAGNLLTKTDPGGNCAATTPTGCTSYGYDNANEPIWTTYSDGSPSLIYGYDADGRRTSLTDATGTSTWTYDSLGRITATSNGANTTIGYGYDLAGNNTTINYPGTGHTVTRGFDAANRLTSVNDWLTNTTSFGYDADSNENNITYPTATPTSDTYDYDPTGQMSSAALATGSTSPITLTYGRGAANQLNAETSTGLSQSAQSYSYNQLEQLTTAGSTASPTTYNYDAADNPIQTTSYATQTTDADSQLCWSSPTTVSSPTCSSIPTGATAYSYDNRGNRTAAATISYSWNQANELTNYNNISNYSYDGNGLLTTRNSSGTTTAYTWQTTGGLPQLLSDGSNNYLYGPDGAAFEQITGTTVAYLHHDQAQSTRAITDTTGTVTATYTYDPYGAVTQTTGSASTNLQYDGQYTDAVSGLIYLRARYYDPTTGEFLSKDPLAAATGAPYSYAGNDPTAAGDPTGLSLCFLGYCLGFHPMAGLDALVNIGRGATFGLTDQIDNLISPGASCTVPQNSGQQFLGGLATTVLTGGGSAEAAESAELRVVNLGGEGEVPGAINQQIPAALQPGWGASRTEVAGKSLAELRQLGDSYVVSENTALPFADASIDRVITNSVPIDIQTILGPGVQSSEIWRILKPGGEWLHNGEVMPWP